MKIAELITFIRGRPPAIQMPDEAAANRSFVESRLNPEELALMRYYETRSPQQRYIDEGIGILGTRLSFHNGTLWHYHTKDHAWIRESARGVDYNGDEERGTTILPTDQIEKAFASAVAQINNPNGPIQKKYPNIFATMPTPDERAIILARIGLT